MCVCVCVYVLWVWLESEIFRMFKQKEKQDVQITNWSRFTIVHFHFPLIHFARDSLRMPNWLKQPALIDRVSPIDPPTPFRGQSLFFNTFRLLPGWNRKPDFNNPKNILHLGFSAQLYKVANTNKTKPIKLNITKSQQTRHQQPTNSSYWWSIVICVEMKYRT